MMTGGCWKVEQKLDNGRAFEPGYVQLGYFGNAVGAVNVFVRTDKSS